VSCSFADRQRVANCAVCAKPGKWPDSDCSILSGSNVTEHGEIRFPKSGCFALDSGAETFVKTVFRSSARGRLVCFTPEIWFSAEGYPFQLESGWQNFWEVLATCSSSGPIRGERLGERTNSYWRVRNRQDHIDGRGFRARRCGATGLPAGKRTQAPARSRCGSLGTEISGHRIMRTTGPAQDSREFRFAK